MHDLSNNKSYMNLGKWIKEVLNTDSFKWRSEDEAESATISPASARLGTTTTTTTTSTTTTIRHTLELDLFRGPLPVLIVGTKADLAHNTRGTTKPSYGMDEIVDRHSIQVVWRYLSPFSLPLSSLLFLSLLFPHTSLIFFSLFSFPPLLSHAFFSLFSPLFLSFRSYLLSPLSLALPVPSNISYQLILLLFTQSAMDLNAFASGTTPHVRLNAFLDQVIYRRFFDRQVSRRSST